MPNILPKNLPKHFWSEESGLTSILILLCVSNFIITPFFEKGQLLHFLIRAVWLALLFTGITTLSESKLQRRWFSVIPVMMIAVNLLLHFHDSSLLVYLDMASDMTGFTLLIVMVFKKVFEKGPVTFHRIVGAVAAYILIGDLWADMFKFLYVHMPGSIQLTSPDAVSVIMPATFTYFSFTTLTTTGFGDILPVSSITRTLVIIEQLIGVFYPAILIGRLVSLTIGKSENSKT